MNISKTRSVPGVLITYAVFFLIALIFPSYASSSERPVGIFSPSAAGGRSAGEAPMKNTLSEAGYSVEIFTSLDIESLLGYDVVIIPNTGRLPQDIDFNWRGSLRAYVRHAGGSLIFYHDAVGLERSPVNYPVALFPEIVPAGESARIETHEVRVEVDPLLGAYPFLPEYDHGQTVRHMYYDHVAFNAASGEVILTCAETGKPVVVAARSAEGRVVYNGTVGLMPEEEAETGILTGIDREILLSTVAWCLEGGGLSETDPANIPRMAWPLEDVKEGLVARWDFNGHIRDVSDGGYHGRWDGAEAAPEANFVEGIPGSGGLAFRFEDEEHFIIHESIDFDVSEPHSVSMWQYLPEDAPRTWNAFIGSRFATGGYWHYHHRGGNLTHYYNVHQGDPILFQMDLHMDAEIPVGRWFHLVITTEPVSPEGEEVNYRVYVNGSLMAERRVDWAPGAKQFRYQNIGGDGTRRRFTGRIDDLRIYDRALSGEEASALYSLWPEAADPEDEPSAAVINFHRLHRYDEYGAEKLRRAGIDSNMITSRMLDELTPEEHPLAVVYFDPDAPVADVEKIRGYLDEGGKAIIFLPGHYLGPSAEWGPELLSDFGCELGETYRNSFRPEEIFGRFRRVVFTDPYHLPRHMDRLPRLLQEIIPVSADAEVIARWEDKLNEAEVAGVIRTPRGVLVNNLGPAQDDDYPHHLWMFLANTAVELLPEITEDVYGNLVDSFEERKEIVTPRAGTPEGREYIEKAVRLRDEAEESAGRGEYKEANYKLLRADEKLMFAYGVSMERKEGEVRMMYIGERDTLGINPEKELSRAAGGGFTAISRAVTSETQYHSDLFAEPGVKDRDELEEWINSSHHLGLEMAVVVHPFTIYPRYRIHSQAREEDWRIVRVGDYGKEPPPMPDSLRRESICRSRTEVTEHVIKKAEELVIRYDIDQIHLDVIRWTDMCVCDNCRGRFEEETGIEVKNWPDEMLENHREAFDEWRAGPITEVVKGVSKALRENSPTTKLGVFTFRDRGSSARRGQHWWEWTEDVDYIMPMWYNPDNERLASMLEGVAELIPADERANLVPCLAALGYQVVDPLVFLEQLDIQHKYGPKGIIYFRVNTMTDADYDFLRKGPFRE